MNKVEFANWMKRHNLSGTLAADFLQLDRKTLDRYISGDLDIPRRVALACWSIDPLRLYRLTPIELAHNDWRASSHKATTLVRAQSETLARWHAVKAFHVAARRRSADEETPADPWSNPERVRATIEKGKISQQPGLLREAFAGSEPEDL